MHGGAGRRAVGLGPLWAKAPLVLLHFRGLFVALAGGAALLALAAAAPPLFVSSVASSALQNEFVSTTRYVAGISFVQNGFFVPPAVPAQGITLGTELSVSERNERIEGALDGAASVGSPLTGVLTNPVLPSRTRGTSSERAIRLLSRTDALAHVERLEGEPDSDGVWLANTTAESLGVGAGDAIFLGRVEADLRPVRVRIAGVYRALYLGANAPYWANLYNQIYPPTPDAGIPEVFAIADERLVVELATTLGLETQLRAEWPLASTGITLPAAEATLRRFRDLERTANDPDTRFGNLVSCEGCLRFEPIDLNTTTSLPDSIDLARETVSTLRGPADLLSTAGLLVALAVLAAAGAFSAARRKVETGVMFARGMSPAAVGVKAAAESFLPVALGVGVGLANALALVWAVGPGAVASVAVVRAAELAALSIPVGAAALGVVAALTFRRHADVAHARGSLARFVPWELAALALAAFLFYRLREEGAFVGDPAEGAARSVGLLLFPFFFIAGMAGLVARGLRRPLGALRRRSGGLGPAGYLAVRRVAGAARLSLLLMVGCAVALGILVYAQAVVRSLDSAVVSKSLLFVGSDVSGTTSSDREIPRGLPYPATMVTKLVERGELDGVPADVMAIDSATFAGAAYWEENWAPSSLASIVEGLPREAGTALPAVVAGSGAEAPGLLEIGGTSVPLEVVERASAFPGMFRSRPLVVADRELLARVFEQAGGSDPIARLGAQTEVWVKGESGPAARALATSELRPFPVLTAEQVRDTPAVRAVTNTFAFLNALGIAAGLLTVVAIVLYVQARQRAGAVAHALARRMGLTDRQHRVSLAVEVAGILGGALALGAALALIAVRLLVRDIDPRPTVPPEPLLDVPWAVIAGTAAILLAVAALGGILVHAVTVRARVAEVLRAGE